MHSIGKSDVCNSNLYNEHVGFAVIMANRGGEEEKSSIFYFSCILSVGWMYPTTNNMKYWKNSFYSVFISAFMLENTLGLTYRVAHVHTIYTSIKGMDAGLSVFCILLSFNFRCITWICIFIWNGLFHLIFRRRLYFFFVRLSNLNQLLCVCVCSVWLLLCYISVTCNLAFPFMFYREFDCFLCADFVLFHF